MIWGSGGSKSRLAKAAGPEPSGQMRDEKAHAVVARSTFPSQNVQNTPRSDHFWKLRCRKSACRCGAKADLEVKMLKTPGVRTTFGGSDVASRGRRKGLCTLSKVSKTWGFCNIFNYNRHYTTLHSNTLITLITLQLQLHLHYILLHYTPLHYTALNYTQLHSTTLHSTTLHYITLHYTTFHYTSLHYTTLQSTTLQLQLHNYTPLHSTTLNYTPLPVGR